MDFNDVKETNIISKRNITELLATPTIFSGIQYGYDKFFSGLSDQQRMTDVYISFASSVIAKLLNYGLVDTTIDQFKHRTENTLVSYLTTPVFNMLIYSGLYYYNFLTKSGQYYGQNAGRSLMEAMTLSAISGLAQQISNKAIISWISGMNYLY
ncbi:hypothetical protein ABPG72_001144 [Tetrahymena utriculariae]